MNNHKIILELYNGPSTRYECPSCHHKGEFVRYINTKTRQYLGSDVGRCNRERNCGYHFRPKLFFAQRAFADEDSIGVLLNAPGLPPAAPPRVVDYLPAALVEKSMESYKDNHLFEFLECQFGQTDADELSKTYRLGTSTYWPGATSFWQIDVMFNIRQAKIMLYDPLTGRRVKDDGDKVTYAGKRMLKNYDANLLQCFFGEHLLPLFPDKIVAIVESEKTAMVASIYFPQLVWLATGGSHGCKWTTKEVCKVLAGREVILFPDLGYYEKWKSKADQVEKQINCKICVSNLLETRATDEERKGGLDIADYLVNTQTPKV